MLNLHGIVEYLNCKIFGIVGKSHKVGIYLVFRKTLPVPAYALFFI